MKRLNLVFDAEDPDAFRTRLNAARLLRDRHERTLQYTRAADEIFEYSNDDLCGGPSFRAKISNACDGCRRNPVQDVHRAARRVRPILGRELAGVPAGAQALVPGPRAEG